MAIFDNISAQFNGAATAFVLTVSGQTVTLPATRDLDIMVGGVGHFENTDYTIVGNQIVFNNAPLAGDLFAGEYSFPEQTGFATTTELNNLSDVVDTKADTSTVTSELSGKADKLTFNTAVADLNSKLNETDANLKDRANHNGSQSISTVTGLQDALDSKSGNDTDANLQARANHTGTQGQSTIDNLVADLAGMQAALTFGINDTNSVKMNGSATPGDYVKFTSTGVEGVSTSTLVTDLDSGLSKSTTPRLSATDVRVTISNWADYSSPTVHVTGDGFQPIYTQAGSVLYITNAGIGAHKIYVQINENGKISSDTAAASLTLPTYRYYRMTFETGYLGGGSIVNEIKFYTGAGQTGTAYPSNMTSNTTPSPFTATQSGSTTPPYKAFDGASYNLGWWSGNGAAGLSSDYLQIDLGASVEIKSMKMVFYASYNPARITVKGSKTGAFTGEEIVLLSMAGLEGGSDINVG